RRRPVLVGSLMRVPVGILTDRIGARLTFSALMVAAAAALFQLSYATSAAQLIAGSMLMGLGGTTFAVGVQSVSSWTVKQHRGFALGIFGAGNVGTAVNTLFLAIFL